MPTEVAGGILYWTRAECGLDRYDGGAHWKEEAFLHYTTGEELGQPDFRAWWRSIDAYHTSKGWNGVGYNHGVARDLHDPGRAHILEGRGWDGTGAHTQGHNTSGYAVVWLGDDDSNVQDVTVGARRAIRWCFVEAGRRHKENLLATVRPHSAVGNTACPGNELRAWIKTGLAVPSGPRPTPPQHPAYPGQSLKVLSKGHPQKVWQTQMRKRGWNVTVDGVYGPESAATARAFAGEKKIPVTYPKRPHEGKRYVQVSRALWDAAWEAKVT